MAVFAGALDGSPRWKVSVVPVLCAFISAFRLGLAPMPWFMVPEMEPSENGGRIQSTMASVSWLLSFLIVKLFKIAVERHPVALWTVFSACSAVGFVFVWFRVPETSNKSREQIRSELED